MMGRGLLGLQKNVLSLAYANRAKYGPPGPAPQGANLYPAQVFNEVWQWPITYGRPCGSGERGCIKAKLGTTAK
jgi:hypothetical protein